MTRMNSILSRRLLLQALVGIPAAVQFGPAFAQEDRVGVVEDARGEVFAELNAQKRKLGKRSDVFLGDVLRTGPKARLYALLGRATSLRLGARSRVRVDRYLFNTGGELVLGNGVLLLDTRGGKFPEGLRIESPYALIAVRGTRVFTGKLDGTFSVFVARGVVDVIGRRKSLRLRSGEGLEISRPGNVTGPAKRWDRTKIERAMALVS